VTATSERPQEPGSRLVEELRLLIDAVAERAGPWLDLVALVRAVLADRWEPGVPHMPGFTPTPRPDGAPRVQKIPVRRKGSG